MDRARIFGRRPKCAPLQKNPPFHVSRAVHDPLQVWYPQPGLFCLLGRALTVHGIDQALFFVRRLVFLFALRFLLSIPVFPLSPLPFIIENRRTSLALVSDTIAVADLETISITLDTALRPPRRRARLSPAGLPSHSLRFSPVFPLLYLHVEYLSLLSPTRMAWPRQRRAIVIHFFPLFDVVFLSSTYHFDDS